MSATNVRRVLVVDDNTDHLLLTRRALDAYEDDVELLIDTVTSGSEALDYLHRRGRYREQPRPHLILLDLRMPGMSGFEVLAQLKGHDHLKRIPVIVLTSSDRAEDIATAYGLGGNSYVTKQLSITGTRQGLYEVARYWFEHASIPEPPR
jgi:CheY-like chemotaxis protein